MKVYLFRHGQAEARAETDTRRQLTAQGRQDNKQVIAQLAARREPLQLILHSPYARAEQTASMLAQVFPSAQLAEMPQLQPECSPADLLATLASMAPQDVALVGHNPLLSKILSLMVDGHTQAARDLGTSNIAAVSIEILAPGCGELLYILTPSASA